jgi:hypothetical protein
MNLFIVLDSTMDTKSTANRNQQTWCPISPNRSMDIMDTAVPESSNGKSQARTQLNEHKQRYPTTNSTLIDTASIPPLMSVRSDPAATANLYKTSNQTGSDHYSQHQEFYVDETGYYDMNAQSNTHYPQATAHNRGYTTLGSYGRYRRSGTHRQQPQQQSYSDYHTSGVSSAPATSSGVRPSKKNGVQRTNLNHRKSHLSSEQRTIPMNNEVISPLMTKQTMPVDMSHTKSIESTVVSPLMEAKHSNEPMRDQADKKSSGMKNNHESNATTTMTLEHKENESNKLKKKVVTVSNVKRSNNREQQSYYQAQQAPRHRNTYTRNMQGTSSIEFFLVLFALR